MLCEGTEVTAGDMTMLLPSEHPKQKPVLIPDGSEDPSLKNLQRRQIEEVLARASSRKEAAEMLGISKTTLWRKCKELGLE